MKFLVRKKSLYVILILTAVLVLADSLDALMRGKDAAMYRQFAETRGHVSEGDYVALVAISFLVGILVPVGYAVYQYVSLRFSGQAPLTRVIWGILLFGALALRALGLTLASVLSLIAFLCLLVLFIHHLLMKSAANGERSAIR